MLSSQPHKTTRPTSIPSPCTLLGTKKNTTNPTRATYPAIRSFLRISKCRVQATVPPNDKTIPTIYGTPNGNVSSIKSNERLTEIQIIPRAVMSFGSRLESGSSTAGKDSTHVHSQRSVHGSGQAPARSPSPD